MAAEFVNSGGRAGRWLGLLKPDGSLVRRLTNDIKYNHGAKISPDGRSVIFYSDVNGSTQYAYDIFRINADGSGLTQLTFEGTHSQIGSDHPTWSPDGSQIAFTKNIADLYVMKSDGSNTQLIAKSLRNPESVYGKSWGTG